MKFLLKLNVFKYSNKNGFYLKLYVFFLDQSNYPKTKTKI
jgi:hypothetical protein